MNEIFTTLDITEATVYPRSAKVKRKISIDFSAKENRIVISELPQNLSADTIRVNLEPNSQLKIVDIFSEDVFKEEYNDNLFIRQQKELKDLIFQKNKLEAKINNLSDEFLIFFNKKSFTSQLKKDFNSPVKSNSWKEFLEFLDEKLTNNRKKSQDIIFEWLILQNKITVATTNLKKYSSYNKKKEHRLSIIVDAPKKLTENIEIEYIQQSVSWYPSYTMRVDQNKNKIAISMFGMLKQTTGQNWENVKLLFSTAMPMQNCSIPNLKAKVIEEKQSNIEQLQSQMINQVSGKNSPAELQMQMSIEAVDDEMPFVQSKEIMSEKKIMPSIQPKSSRKLKKELLKQKVINQHFKKGFKKDDKIYDQVQKPNIEIQNSGRGFKTGKPESKVTQKQSIINSIIESIDTKFSTQLSISNFSHYYELLYDYMNSKFDPEQEIDKTKKQSVIDFFLQEVPLTQSIGGYDYRYLVESTNNSIPSLDTPSIIDITTTEFPIEFSFVAIPLEKEQVYLRGRFKNTDTRPIPSGPSQIFIENNFLGNLIFPNLSENESTFLSLGVERNIKINRKENFIRRTKGFVGNSIISDYTIEIEIVNYLDKEISIDVLDRIPLTNQKNIEIQDIKYDMTPTKITKRNILLWELTMQAKEKKKIKFYYSIKHPENFQLSIYNADSPYIVE